MPLTYFSFTGQINDLADKLQTWDNHLTEGSSDKKVEDKLAKATKDSAKITTEVLQGIMSQVIKDKLFNHSATAVVASGSSPDPTPAAIQAAPKWEECVQNSLMLTEKYQ